MQCKTIIGLAGKARTGKDTIADYLCSRYDFERIAFADPLKRMLREGFGIPDTYMVHEKEKPIPFLDKSYRELAQTLGTEWGRQIVHPDLWVRFASHVIESMDASRIVITDVRFPNEAAWLRVVGEVWHVYRPYTDAVRIHCSENGIAWEPGEKMLDNIGSLEFLYDLVDRAVEETL